MQTNRRGFLAGLVVLGGSVSGLTLPLGGCRRRADEAVDRLTVAIAETVEAESLGAEYLSRYPEESDLGELRSILASSLPGALVTSDAIGAFHQRIVQDFDDGSTVRFGGWLFSRSELRLYAVETLRRRALRTPYREGMFPIEDDGTDRYHWTGPSAALDVTAAEQDLKVRLRSVAPMTQTVLMRSDGTTISQVKLRHGMWEELKYRPPGRTTRLELVVTPTWQPRNDFRTLGVQWGAPLF